MKICCITGHRPQNFPFDYENKESTQYKKYIACMYEKVFALAKEGYELFISGMADGADTDFFDAVMAAQTRLASLGKTADFEAAFPYPNKKSEIFRKEYPGFALSVISDKYDKGCFQKRNRYMVDKSDLVLAFWSGKTSGGTWNTLKYARASGKKIEYLCHENDF